MTLTKDIDLENALVETRHQNVQQTIKALENQFWQRF